MDYKKYLDFDKICNIGGQELKKENFRNNDPIIYFVNKLGILADKSESLYSLAEKIDNEEFSFETMDLIDEILDKFLLKIDFFSDDFLSDYNSKFNFAHKCYKDMNENPFKIAKTQLNEFYKSINQDEEQSCIEIQLKITQLFNRCAHIMDEFNSYILSRFVNTSYYNGKNIDNECKKDRKFKLYYEKTLNKNEEFFKSLCNICDKKDNLANRYVALYESYLNNEISMDKLKESDVAKSLLGIVNHNKNDNDILPTYDVLYSYFRSINIRTKMYCAKNYSLEMAVKQYVNEQDENEKSKYKITTSQDTNLKNRKFSKLLNFYVKGYNAPYSFHRDDGTMNEMKKLLGDIEVESDLKENKLLLQYKYTDDQKEGILDFEKVFRRYSGKSDEYYCDFKKMVDEIFKNVLDDDRENIIK